MYYESPSRNSDYDTIKNAQELINESNRTISASLEESNKAKTLSDLFPIKLSISYDIYIVLLLLEVILGK